MNKTCAKCSRNSQLYSLQKCRHVFCYKCLYEHVNKLESFKIKCLLASCNKDISDKDIRKFLSTYRIEIFDKSQFKQGTIQKCLTKGCLYIYISDCETIFQCEYCEQPNCTKCKKRHYPNECKNNEDHEETREKNAQEIVRRRKRNEIESFDLKADLVPNFDGFDCPICLEFFLPNTQVMLRTCQHEFCFECLKSSLKLKKSFDQLRCQICHTSLTAVELNKLVGMEFVDSLNKSIIQPKMYKCKYPDCCGFWDYDSQKKGTYECPVCKNINCISCGVVHKINENCSQFKETKEYKNVKSAEKEFKTRSIECICGKLLIHGGGCGALCCDNCYKQICLFTGKLAGISLPEGCGCTSSKPCHVDCKFGCFPENK